MAAVPLSTITSSSIDTANASGGHVATIRPSAVGSAAAAMFAASDDPAGQFIVGLVVVVRRVVVVLAGLGCMIVWRSVLPCPRPWDGAC